MIVIVVFLGHDPYNMLDHVVRGAFIPEPYQAPVEGLYADVVADNELRRVW